MAHTQKINICSFLSLRVFIILITLIAISGCSNHGVAPVSDMSKSAPYRGRIYVVQPGETLYSIAWKNGLDVKKLCEFNKIEAPFKIIPGQRLKLDPTIDSGIKTLAKPSQKTSNSSKSNAVTQYGTRSKQAPEVIKNPSFPLKNGSAVIWQWPSTGKLIAQFSGENASNKGIDIGGKLGEPVLAAASGQVVYAGSGLSSYGKLLIIKHNDAFLSAYAHNSELLVKEGEIVKVGQRIADMGSSGTDRVKLHFEIRSEGSPVNPLVYLPKR